GDQRVVTARDPPLECRQEAARWGRRLRGRLDLPEGPRGFRRRDLLALVGFDFGENVRHDHALEILTSRSSRPSASPDSSALVAIPIPSFKSFALPATMMAAAALSSATSRNGHFLPFKTSIRAFALVSASPPRSSSGFATFSPTSSGLISKVVTLPFSSEATAVEPEVVISSSPSEPCTT